MCSGRKIRKTKIIKIGGDRYHQVLEYCTGCLVQTSVRLDELKKGNHRGNN